MPTRSAKARTGATNIREAIKAMKKASRPAAMRQAPQDTRVAVPKQQKHDTAISVATLQTKRLSPALGCDSATPGGSGSSVCKQCKSSNLKRTHQCPAVFQETFARTRAASNHSLS